MAEKEKPKYKSTVFCGLKENGQWDVNISITSLPLSGREKTNLMRTILVETKKSLREFNLKQRAQMRLATEKLLTSKVV